MRIPGSIISTKAVSGPRWQPRAFQKSLPGEVAGSGQSLHGSFESH